MDSMNITDEAIAVIGRAAVFPVLPTSTDTGATFAKARSA